jgi:hypothetical protein
MIYSMVFVDLTSAGTPSELRPAPQFGRIIDALKEQLDHDYAPEYGPVLYTFRVACSPSDREVGEIAVNFRDTIPEAPGALAYHTVTNGVPDIELGVDLFASLTEGQESLSCGLSHEVLEMLGDPGANLWSDRQDAGGHMDARELCDFVQNTSYQASNGVTLSNFVLGAFFIPASVGPWDFLDVMKSQYDVRHGYGIQAPSPQENTQIGGIRAALATLDARKTVGKILDSQIKRKRLAYSRSYRRGLRLA